MPSVIDSNIVSIHAARQSRADGWISGAVRCQACGYAWESISPAGCGHGQLCPACGHLRGEYVRAIEPAFNRFHCRCGNDLFHIVRNAHGAPGVMCAGCGLMGPITAVL